MKRKVVCSLVFVALAMLIGITASASNEACDVPNFNIEIDVDQTKGVISMKCSEGCAWKTLSIGCEDAAKCSSSFDAFGTPAE